MSERSFNVLFLCTGNSARSIMAEAILNSLGRGRFKAYSAGSRPKGAVHPLALKVLSSATLPIDELTSKSWEVFAQPGAPVMHFVFTVCDNAAGETCPVWPGHPATAHWGIEDPAAVEGTELEKEKAFVTSHALFCAIASLPSSVFPSDRWTPSPSIRSFAVSVRCLEDLIALRSLHD